MLMLKEKNDTLVRLHLLIQRKATGSPVDLSRRLGVSKPTVFRYLQALRSYDAPIAYCKQRECYYYEHDFELKFF